MRALAVNFTLLLFLAGVSAQELAPFTIASFLIDDSLSCRQQVNFAPTFTWTYSHPAQSYLLELQLKTQDSLIWETGLFMTDHQTSFQLPGLGLLERGQTYTMSIRAQHPELGWSPTLAVSFTMNTPPTTPQLDWNAGKILRGYPLLFNLRPASDRQCPAGSLLYHLQIACDTLFQHLVLDTICNQPALREIIPIRVDKFLPDNAYYYVRVRASDGVEYSPWSRHFPFGLDAVNAPPRSFSLLAPPDGSQVSQPPLLRWELTSDPDEEFDDGIKEYVLELATDSLMRQLVLRRTLKPTQNSYQLNALDNHQRYYWRLRAVDSRGAVTFCRRIFTFLTDFGNLPPDAPQLLAPLDSAIINPRGYFEWVLPLDPEGDSLNCELRIWSSSEPARVYSLPLSGTKIQKTWSEKDPDLTLTPERRIRVRLAHLPFYQALRDGWTYQWEVLVFDAWGGRSSSSQPNAFFIFDDGINQPPGAPVSGFQPADKIVDVRQPILRWDPVKDPDVGDRVRYQVMLSRERRFAARTFIMQESLLDEPSIRLGAPLIENALYYWKVRAVDLKGATSAWSPVLSFWVNSVNEPPQAAPHLFAPHHLAVVTPQTYFFWEDVADPDPGDSVDYLLEFSGDPNFKETVCQLKVERRHCRSVVWRERGQAPKAAIGINLSALPQSMMLRDNGLYYWRVIPVDRQNARGQPAPERYRIAYNSQNDPPYPVVSGFTPRSGSLVKTLRPEISWDATSDPDFDDFQSQLVYQVELAPAGDFPADKTRSVESEPGITTVKLSEDLTENAKWFYRIRARDKKGAFSEWSGLQFFITDAIQEAPYSVTTGFLPSDSAIVDTHKPILTWLPSDDPDPLQTSEHLTYLVRCFAAKDGKLVGQFTSLPGVPSVQLSGLKEDQYYFYQVAAVDPDKKQSPWSKPIYFGVNTTNSAPSPFQLLAPHYKQDSVAVDVHFCWQKAIDVDPNSKVSYTLYYSPDSTFGSGVTEVVINPDIADSLICYQPTLPLDEGRRYYWKVVARDEQGASRWASSSDKKPFVFRTVGQRNFSGGDDLSTIRLYQNYPNPFNVTTRIQYEVPEYTNLEVAIYDLLGQKVKSLASGAHPRGIYTVYWDGTDEAGTLLPGGVYICRLSTRGEYINRKVILLR